MINRQFACVCVYEMIECMNVLYVYAGACESECVYVLAKDREKPKGERQSWEEAVVQ